MVPHEHLAVVLRDEELHRLLLILQAVAGVVQGVPKEQVLPHGQVLVQGRWDAGDARELGHSLYWLGVDMVEGVLEQVLRVVVDERPHRYCLVSYIILVSFSLVITHKRAVFARVYFNCNICEHSLVELKHVRHLHMNHAYQVQELNEDGTSLLILVVLVVVAESPRELMAEREPLFLNQLLEAPDRTVSAIEQNLSEGSQLGRSVPPVSAVNENVIFMIYDSVHDVVYSRKNVGGQVHILRIL